MANMEQLVADVGELLDRRRQAPHVAPSAVFARVIRIQKLFQLHRLGQKLAQQRTGEAIFRSLALGKVVHES